MSHMTRAQHDRENKRERDSQEVFRRTEHSDGETNLTGLDEQKFLI